VSKMNLIKSILGWGLTDYQ